MPLWVCFAPSRYGLSELLTGSSLAQALKRWFRTIIGLPIEGLLQTHGASAAKGNLANRARNGREGGRSVDRVGLNHSPKLIPSWKAGKFAWEALRASEASSFKSLFAFRWRFVVGWGVTSSPSRRNAALATATDTIWLRSLDLSDSGRAWLAEEKSTTSLAAEIASKLRGFQEIGHRVVDHDWRRMIQAFDEVAGCLGADDKKLGEDLRLLVAGLEMWGELEVKHPDGTSHFNCEVNVLPDRGIPPLE